jgi:hypothetical protein
MNGTPAEVFELGVRDVIITIVDGRYPPELHSLMQMKRRRTHVVVHQDTGVPVTTLAEYAPAAWIENVERSQHPIEELIGMFG